MAKSGTCYGKGAKVEQGNTSPSINHYWTPVRFDPHFPVLGLSARAGNAYISCGSGGGQHKQGLGFRASCGASSRAKDAGDWRSRLSPREVPPEAWLSRVLAQNPSPTMDLSPSMIGKTQDPGLPQPTLGPSVLMRHRST